MRNSTQSTAKHYNIYKEAMLKTDGYDGYGVIYMSGYAEKKLLITGNFAQSEPLDEVWWWAATKLMVQAYTLLHIT